MYDPPMLRLAALTLIALLLAPATASAEIYTVGKKDVVIFPLPGEATAWCGHKYGRVTCTAYRRNSNKATIVTQIGTFDGMAISPAQDLAALVSKRGQVAGINRYSTSDAICWVPYGMLFVGTCDTTT